VATNGKARIGVLLVRHATPLFTDVLAKALGAERTVRLLTRPLLLEEALEFCRRHHPDVVLIEATETRAAALPGLIRPITGACDGAPVVVLADEVVDDDFLVAGVEAGASGILDASVRIDGVVRAVHAAAAGKRLVDWERLLNAVEATARSREEERRHLELIGHLTRRERDVLACLVEGLRNAQIAERFAISHRTVEKHVQNVLRKLEVSSRLEAIARFADGGSPVRRHG
jgi:DNA-binding NarL/FixJ family response regulator